MKSSLAYTLIVLQVLILVTVIGAQMQSQRSMKGTVDRLEQIKDSLAGSVTRQSDYMLRLKTAIEDIGRLQDQMKREGVVRSEAASGTSSAGGSSTASATDPPSTADEHLRRLLDVFHQMRAAQQNGTEMKSVTDLFHSLEETFVARGQLALLLLPEEMRANRDEEVRRYLLGDLLPKFAGIDQGGCFLAARKVMLDAAASAPLRKLAARQALAFDKDKALVDIRDMLGRSGATNVELRVELLDVLQKYPDPELQEGVCRLAEDKQFGPRIQTAAIRLLPAYGTKEALESLRRIVDGGTPNAQVEALEAIAKIMKADAVPYLEEVASKDPKTVPEIVRTKAKNLADGLKG